MYSYIRYLYIHRVSNKNIIVKLKKCSMNGTPIEWIHSCEISHNHIPRCHHTAHTNTKIQKCYRLNSPPRFALGSVILFPPICIKTFTTSVGPSNKCVNRWSMRVRNNNNNQTAEKYAQKKFLCFFALLIVVYRVQCARLICDGVRTFHNVHSYTWCSNDHFQIGPEYQCRQG